MQSNTDSPSTEGREEKTEEASVDIIKEMHAYNIEVLKKWLLKHDQTHRQKINYMLKVAAAYLKAEVCQTILDCVTIEKNIVLAAAYMACAGGRLATIQVLAKHCDITETNCLHKMLTIASIRGYQDVIMWLTGDVCQLSEQESARWLLATASGVGDMDRVKALLVNMDVSDVNVMSLALNAASHYNRSNVTSYLMTHTAASVSSRHIAVLRNITDDMTPLMAACIHGCTTVARQLSIYASPYAINMTSGRKQDTALHLVLWYNTSIQDFFNACSGNNMQVIFKLLHKLDINTQNLLGNTPLHNACYAGHIEVVRALLSVFAHTNITNDDCDSPAVLAMHCGHTQLLSLV
jgi:hypothetical protein